MNAIKFFLKQIFEILYYKIKSSIFYNTLVEKYENLDLHHQKWISRGFFTTLIVVITFIPLSFIWGSIQKSNEFKEKYKLVSYMLQTPASSKSSPSMNATRWNERINQLIGGLSSEQNARITPYKPSRYQIPSAFKKLTHAGKKIQVEGLNIQEVVDIGYALDQMDSAVKLIEMKIEKSSLAEHYFKATYFVFLFFNPK